MAITILSRKYNTRNHATGNTFLLANSGQLIAETIEFTVDFDFTSSTQFSVTFPGNFQIQLLGGNWGDYGMNIGDAIQLTGTITQGTQTITYSNYAVTITDIVNDIMTVNTTLDPAGTGILIGAIMPTSSVGTTPLAIKNTTATAPQALELWHNLVENSSAGNPNSLIDGEVNRFRTDAIGSLAVGSSLDFEQLGNQSGGAYAFKRITRLSDVGGKRRFQTVLFYWPPFLFQDGSFDEPSYLEAAQSLKPYFEIYAIPQVNNPNAQLKIAYGANLGNVGWLNENYNQGVNDFTYELSIEDTDGNPLDEIDYNQTNYCTVKVYSVVNILNKIEAQFYLVPPASTYKNKPNSHADLIRYSSAYYNGSVSISSAYGVGAERMTLENVAFSQLTGYAQITFEITPNDAFKTYADGLTDLEKQYRVTLTCENISGTANNNNSVTLNLIEGILTKNPIQGGVFPGVVSQYFKNHKGDVVDAGRFATEDDFIYQSQFNLDKGNAYKSLRTSIVVQRDSDGAQFELASKLIPFSPFITTPNGVIQINYNEPIQQFLDNPEANKLTLALTGTETVDNYEVALSWSLMANWRYWIAQPNAFTSLFDNTLPNVGLNAEWMRYLREAGYSLLVYNSIIDESDIEYYFKADFSLFDYDHTDDLVCEIELYDTSNNLQTVLLDNQLMTIRATFTNLGAGTWDLPNIWGFISLRPFEADPNKRLSTFWEFSPQDKPLQPQNGFTVTEVQNLSATSVQLVCLVDTSQITASKSTIIARINQESPDGTLQLVHKQDFNKVLLPKEAISEDRGASFCREPQLVLASLSDAAYYKNDRTAIAFKFDEMTIELEDANGNLAPAPGITVNFPYQPDAKGFVIDWRQVTNGSILLQGCYKVRVNWEISGNTGWFYYGSYNLLEYSPSNALGTVRLFVVLDDLVRKQGINYKNSGFAGTVRFRGQFGYMQPKYDTENIIYTDRRREKVRNEALRTYEMRSSYLLSCMTRLIDEECLLTANQIYISDHNANNHVQNLYFDFPVILSEEESPQFEYTDSVFAKIKAVFVDKVAYYESKYDGSIKGSENVILQLPTVTTGGGGICENVTVHNTDNTYFESVPSGGDLELEDTTFAIYVNGVLNQSVNLPAMANHTINIYP